MHSTCLLQVTPTLFIETVPSSVLPWHPLGCNPLHGRTCLWVVGQQYVALVEALVAARALGVIPHLWAVQRRAGRRHKAGRTDLQVQPRGQTGWERNCKGKEPISERRKGCVEGEVHSLSLSCCLCLIPFNSKGNAVGPFRRWCQGTLPVLGGGPMRPCRAPQN